MPDPVTDPALQPATGQSGQWGEMARLAPPPIAQLLLSRIIGLIGMPGGINSAITDASGKVAGWLGEDPGRIAAFKKAVNESPLNVLPTSDLLANSKPVKSLAARDCRRPAAGLARATTRSTQSGAGILGELQHMASPLALAMMQPGASQPGQLQPTNVTDAYRLSQDAAEKNYQPSSGSRTPCGGLAGLGSAGILGASHYFGPGAAAAKPAADAATAAATGSMGASAPVAYPGIGTLSDLFPAAGAGHDGCARRWCACCGRCLRGRRSRRR